MEGSGIFGVRDLIGLGAGNCCTLLPSTSLWDVDQYQLLTLTRKEQISISSEASASPVASSDYFAVSSLGFHALSYFHIYKTKNVFALFISGGKMFCTNTEIMTSAAGSMLPTTINLGFFCGFSV